MKKKAMLDGLIFLLAAAAIVVVFFLFYKVQDFSKTEAERKIIEEITSADSSDILINYLNTPFNADMNIADAIALSQIDSTYLDQIKIRTQNIFAQTFSNKVYWKLEIDNDEIKNDGERITKIFFKDTTLIPGHDTAPITIQLTID